MAAEINNNKVEVISLLEDDDGKASSFVGAVATRVLADGCVEILDSDDDEKQEDRKPAAVNKRTASKLTKENVELNGSSKRRKEPAPQPLEPSAEVILTNSPTHTFVPATIPNNNNTDEIELMGSTGNNALIDFPHARENCVQFPFATVPASQHCANCYCFVCDVPVKECTTWENHCKATFSSAYWKAEREGRQRPPSLNNTTNAGANASSLTTTMAAPSTGIAIASVVTKRYLSHREFNAVASRNPASVSSLLEAATRVYPCEVSPPNPFRTALRHYQKQSLAFMIHAEESSSTAWTMNGIDTRGGWLCSEVGMGKSACVIALVASKPMPAVPATTQVKGRRLLKGTVIMTSVSLMGQWEDECRKHAPHLKVVRAHTSAKTPHYSQIYKADIIISSATFDWEKKTFGSNLSNILFHRVVMDESHLFVSRQCSANPDHAVKIPAARRWCVTATPFIGSARDLWKQCFFLGMTTDLCRRLQEDPSTLKEYMIRHVKSQQINGSRALALPQSNFITKMVTMSETERVGYDSAIAQNRSGLYRLRGLSECSWYPLRNQVTYALSAPLTREDSPKMKALEESLLNLMHQDPDMRAVVFTQFREVFSNIRTMVRTRFQRVRVYSFDGSTGVNQRDLAIRQFQSKQQGPAVFVITYGTGAVGITLTAASHVFLMEPCIDPSDETQAAGRIHRLGQTKPVAVTKFVYRDSFESNILQLHDEVAAGRIEFSSKGISNAALRILLHGVP